MKLNHKQIIWTGAAVVVFFLIVSASLAYLSPSRDLVTNSFKKLYPAAIVGSTPVSIDDADEFVTVARSMDSSVTAPAAYQTFLDHKKAGALLRDLNIKLGSDADSDELTFYTKGNEQAYSDLLNNYFGNNQNAFVRTVVEPDVTEASLRIYYNADKSLNVDAWNKINTVLAQINDGAKFEDLAKTYSDDKQSGQFGGDMGFFEHGQILPELEKQIVVAKFGAVDTNIIVTRDGYEIIYPIEESDQNGVKMWHAKHILIQTNGFDQWLLNQTKNISTITLKKF